jgi:hypothetical protein
MADRVEGAKDGGAGRKIVGLADVKAGVKMSTGRYMILVVKGGEGSRSTSLSILTADGKPGDDPLKLRLGAGSPIQLKWSVAGATKATLSAKSLVEKTCEAADKPADATHVSNDQLLSAGVDLTLDANGSGSGVVLVDPGPCGSTEYTIAVTAKDGAEAPDPVKASAFVANFNVQLELPDGSDYARNKKCVLEIPGQSAVEGTTNDSGELWLWVPNVAAESATLRLLDGGSELATWEVTLHAEEGVPDGALAVNDAPGEKTESVA